MSFVEWYESTYQEKWHQDYVLLYSFAGEMIKAYKEYCKKNHVKPEWNG
jgi:hypothetical protein